jgi:hypothetical protein
MTRRIMTTRCIHCGAARGQLCASGCADGLSSERIRKASEKMFAPSAEQVHVFVDALSEFGWDKVLDAMRPPPSIWKGLSFW